MAGNNNLDVTVDNASDSLTLSGNITGSGVLTKYGAGTLILSGTDNDFASMEVNTGILEVMASDALPVGSGLTVDANGTVYIGDPSGAGSSVAVTSSFAVPHAGGVAAVPEPSTSALLADWRLCWAE